MKIEYTQSISNIGPDMVISGAEFLKGWESDVEYNFLQFAVDAFTFAHGFENNLDRTDYCLAQRWLKKNSYIRFVIREMFYSPISCIRWCEICVMTEGNIQWVVTSEDGDQFFRHVPPLNRKRGVSHKHEH